MRTALRTIVVLTIAALALGNVPALGRSSADNACYRYKRSEKRFKDRTNRARAERGITRLKLDPELSKVARTHAHEMAAEGTPFHTPAETLGRRVTNWNVLGENVGRGTRVIQVHRAFMDSSGHRTNILNPNYKRLGVGTVRSNGMLYVTVVFESYTNPGTTLRMPSC